MFLQKLNPDNALYKGLEFDPFKEMHRMIHSVFKGEDLWPRQDRQEFIPSIDIAEKDGIIQVSAELPGLSENDVEVLLDKDYLTIQGEKKFESEENKEGYHWMERRYGSFKRSIRLPEHVDAENIDASFKDGVLTVKLPRTEPKEEVRKIKIS